MSEDILLFRSQLSGIMETVLRGAVCEITRLAEASFLEEVVRCREEVKALKEKLQWRVQKKQWGEKCADCGRVGALVGDRAHRTKETPPGVDEWYDINEGCESNRRNPFGERMDTTHPWVSVEETTPVSTEAQEMAVHRSECEREDLDQPPGENGHVGEPRTGLDGARVANGVHLHVDLKEQVFGEKWSPSRCPGIKPPSEQFLIVEVDNMCNEGGLNSSNNSELSFEEAAHEMKRPESGHCPTGQNKLGLDHVMHKNAGQQETSFAHSDMKADCDGLDLEGADSCLSSLGSLSGKPESGLVDSIAIKEETELQPVCSEEARSGTSHGQNREYRPKASVVTFPYIGCPYDAMRPQNLCFVKTKNPAFQTSETQSSLCVKQAQTAVSELAEKATSDAPCGKDCSPCATAASMSEDSGNQQRTGTEGKPFSCLHCGKAFAQFRNLKAHERYHTGNKSHRCTQCGRGFVYMSHLKVHLQSHTGQRPFSCAQCGKSFTYLCNLKSHQQYHTGDRPFSCTQCGKSFSHLRYLKRHWLIHSAERPYSCFDCGKRYAANSDLKRHRQVHTQSHLIK